MGAAYGDQGGLPSGTSTPSRPVEPVRTRWDPVPYSPIHDDDINAQLEPLLDAATVPATIVNWAGDEPVSVQEWSAYFGELLGVRGGGRRRAEIPGASRRLGRRPHQALRDHRAVPGRLAGGVPPRGRALLPRPACGADVTDRYPAADELLAEARAAPALATSARATSATASTCCSTAWSTTAT